MNNVQTLQLGFRVSDLWSTFQICQVASRMRRKITVAFGVDKWSRDEMNSGLRTERQGSEGMKHVEHRRPATHPALWQYTPGLMAGRIQAATSGTGNAEWRLLECQSRHQ